MAEFLDPNVYGSLSNFHSISSPEATTWDRFYKYADEHKILPNEAASAYQRIASITPSLAEMTDAANAAHEASLRLGTIAKANISASKTVRSGSGFLNASKQWNRSDIIDAGNAAWEGFSGLNNGVDPIAAKLGSAIEDEEQKKISKKLKSGFKQIELKRTPNIFGAGFSGLEDDVDPAAAKLGADIENVEQNEMASSSGLIRDSKQKFVDDISNKTHKIGSSISDGFSFLGGKTSALLGSAKDNIGSMIKSAGSKIIDGASFAGRGIKSAVGGIMSVGESFGSIADNVLPSANDIDHNLSIAAQKVKKIGSSITQAPSSIRSNLHDMSDAAVGGLSDFGSSVKDLGSSIGSGISNAWGGIKSHLPHRGGGSATPQPPASYDPYEDIKAAWGNGKRSVEDLDESFREITRKRKQEFIDRANGNTIGKETMFRTLVGSKGTAQKGKEVDAYDNYLTDLKSRFDQKTNQITKIEQTQKTLKKRRESLFSGPKVTKDKYGRDIVEDFDYAKQDMDKIASYLAGKDPDRKLKTIETTKGSSKPGGSYDWVKPKKDGTYKMQQLSAKDVIMQRALREANGDKERAKEILARQAQDRDARLQRTLESAKNERADIMNFDRSGTAASGGAEAAEKTGRKLGWKGKAGGVVALLALGGIIGNQFAGGHQSNAQLYNPSPQPQYYS